MLLVLPLLGLALCGDQSRVIEPVVDFFWPGTTFIIKLPEALTNDCAHHGGGQLKLYLKIDKDAAVQTNPAMPITLFDLSLEENSVDTTPENQMLACEFILKSTSDNTPIFPDTVPEGVYSNAVFTTNLEGEEQYVSRPITFYKSQMYIENTNVTLFIPERGVYSPSLSYNNYQAENYVATTFEYYGPTQPEEHIYELSYSGVTECDHVAVYDRDINGPVITIPTLNLRDKNTPAIFRNAENSFHLQFVSSANFDIAAYAPIVHYRGYEEKDNSTIVFNIVWTVSTVSDGKVEPLDYGAKVLRGTKLHIGAEISYNSAFLKVDTDKNFLLAMCHINQDGQSWMYSDPLTCKDMPYGLPPPYSCSIIGNKKGESVEYTYADSTFFVGQFLIEEDEEPVGIKTMVVEEDFDTSAVNPIPFRIVVLRETATVDNDTTVYSYQPLGPATAVYELELVPDSAVIFIVVLILVVIILCVVSYFVGMAIVKRRKHSNKVVMSDLIRSEPEDLLDGCESLLQSDNRGSSSSNLLLSESVTPTNSN